MKELHAHAARGAREIFDGGERVSPHRREQVAAPAHDDADGVRERLVKKPVVSRADAAVRNREGRGSLRGGSRSKHGRRRIAAAEGVAAGQSTTATTWISTSCS